MSSGPRRGDMEFPPPPPPPPPETEVSDAPLVTYNMQSRVWLFGAPIIYLIHTATLTKIHILPLPGADTITKCEQRRRVHLT